MGKVTPDTQLGRKLLMLCILGSVVQRERLSTSCREFLEPIDDCLVRLYSAFFMKLGDQNEPAFSLGQCI